MRFPRPRKVLYHDLVSAESNAWRSVARLAEAATGFVSRQHSRGKSLFLSKPPHERELPASNLTDGEEAAAMERERLHREISDAAEADE